MESFATSRIDCPCVTDCSRRAGSIRRLLDPSSRLSRYTSKVGAGRHDATFRRSKDAGKVEPTSNGRHTCRGATRTCTPLSMCASRANTCVSRDAIHARKHLFIAEDIAPVFSRDFQDFARLPATEFRATLSSTATQQRLHDDADFVALRRSSTTRLVTRARLQRLIITDFRPVVTHARYSRGLAQSRALIQGTDDLVRSKASRCSAGHRPPGFDPQGALGRTSVVRPRGVEVKPRDGPDRGRLGEAHGSDISTTSSLLLSGMCVRSLLVARTLLLLLDAPARFRADESPAAMSRVDTVATRERHVVCLQSSLRGMSRSIPRLAVATRVDANRMSGYLYPPSLSLSLPVSLTLPLSRSCFFLSRALSDGQLCISAQPREQLFLYFFLILRDHARLPLHSVPPGPPSAHTSNPVRAAACDANTPTYERVDQTVTMYAGR